MAVFCCPHEDRPSWLSPSADPNPLDAVGAALQPILTTAAPLRPVAEALRGAANGLLKGLAESEQTQTGREMCKRAHNLARMWGWRLKRFGKSSWVSIFQTNQTILMRFCEWKANPQCLAAISSCIAQVIGASKALLTLQSTNLAPENPPCLTSL